VLEVIEDKCRDSFVDLEINGIEETEAELNAWSRVLLENVTVELRMCVCVCVCRIEP
jgi:hypothetical protein